MLWVVCLHNDKATYIVTLMHVLLLLIIHAYIIIIIIVIILGLITSRGNAGVCYNASYVHLQATSWTVWL